MEVIEFPVDEEYKKNPKITPEDVGKIRQWLQTQPHLPEPYITDLDIILAYHSCNYSIEVTKQVMDMNYSLRTHITSYFKDRLFDAEMVEEFNKQLFVVLPTKSFDGCSVLYTHAIDTDPASFKCTESIKALFMAIDLWQYEYGTVPGLEVVVNFHGYNMAHLPKIDLRNLQMFLNYVQEAIPLKLKKFHLLNTPPFIDRLMTLVKPFIKNDLLQAITPHREGSNTIEKYMPLEAFPEDAGGGYKPVNVLQDEVMQKMRANRSYFEKENKKRVEESLRPGKPKVFNPYGGLEGSFKKLEID